MLFDVIHFDSINSTNTYLKEHYDSLNDLTFVSTDYQSNGKGRNDRKWLAIKGENLLFSLLIKNKDIVDLGGYLSLVSAYSISKVLENKYGLNNVSIKWPNDIYIGDKKVCGILLEGRLPDYLIIGIGINVNQKLFEGDYRISPTSISLEINKDIDINILKENIYHSLYESITHIDDLKDEFISYFSKHNYLKDKDIEIYIDNELVKGQVQDIDKDFALYLKVNNEIIKVTSGEINIK